MIETERLTIGPWSEEDAPAFFDLTQDPGFLSFPITDWRQKDLDSAGRWIREMNEHFAKTRIGAFAVREKVTGELIGMVALRVLELEKESRPEITYRFMRSAWGKGFAFEAARALLRYGFEEIGFDEIAASITPDNDASIKMALKLGMRPTGSEILLGVSAEIFRLRATSKIGIS